MTPLQPGDDSLVLGVERALAAVSIPVLEMHLLGTGSIQDQLLVGLGELLPRLVDRKVTQLCRRLDHPGEVLTAGTRPGSQGGGRQRVGRGGHDQLRIDLELGPESDTGGTGAIRRVEREVPGRWILETGSAVGTGQMLAEGNGL